MTVLSLQWLAARPRRRAAVIGHVSPARRRAAVIGHLSPARRRAAVIGHSSPARRERRTYRDSFFADPAAVEDDSRRMSQRGGAAR